MYIDTLSLSLSLSLTHTHIILYYIILYYIVYIYIYIYMTDRIRTSRNFLTCYLEPKLAQCVWVYSYKIQKKTSKWLFTFLARGDVYRFSLATFGLRLNSSSILTFSGVCSAVLRTWRTFYCRIACRNNSFGRVAWESKYDFGRPKICKEPKNIPDGAILGTLWVCDYNINIFYRYT